MTATRKSKIKLEFSVYATMRDTTLATCSFTDGPRYSPITCLFFTDCIILEGNDEIVKLCPFTNIWVETQYY